MRSTTSMPLLPGPHWPRIASPAKVLSVGQIEMFDIYTEWKQMTPAKLNCLK